MWVFLGIGALVAWALFHCFETVNGLRHFTKHGRNKAVDLLGDLAVTPTVSVFPNAAAFEIVQLDGLSGSIALTMAESNGGVVILSEGFLDHPIGSQFFVVQPGDETIASEGSGLAILSQTPA